MISGTLFGQERTGMYLSKSLVSGIRFQYDIRLNMSMGILEQPEIMLLSIGKC